MKRAVLKIFAIVVLIFGMVLPALPTLACYNYDCNEGYYTFRSTVTGSGVRQTGKNVYEIVNQKTNFSTKDRVIVMTRIFGITDINNFRFKHELVGNGIRKVIDSPLYRPNGRWWSEIYYWYDFGTLPEGEYDITSYVNVDNEGCDRLRVVHIKVNRDCYSRSGNYKVASYYPGNKKRDNYRERYYRNPEYSYNWTQTGKNIRKTGNYTYEIINNSADFNTNESVYVLTKTTNINYVDRFRIKHEVYVNGRIYKTDITPEMRPGGDPWEYNYTWANLGPLPAGNHEIKAYISVNGDGFKFLNSVSVYVTRYCQHDNYWRDDYDSEDYYNRSRSDGNVVYNGNNYDRRSRSKNYN